MSVKMNSEKCIFVNSEVNCTLSEKGLKVLSKKRKETVSQKSLLRKDSFHESLHCEDDNPLYFHDNCIKTYCSDAHIERYLKKQKMETTDDSSAKVRTRRSEVQDFVWKIHCPFCGEACNITRDKKNPSRWREAYECHNLSIEGKDTFKENILQVNICYMYIILFYKVSI